MKMPALQFYPADWRKDPGVQSLSYFERGVWFEMLCMMHESEERGVLLLNSAPMPEEALANALGLDNQILTTTLTKLTTYGVAKRRKEDGAIFNKRMVEDERICKIRREVGKKGGNPALLNQKTTTIVNQNPTPSSSSSSSTSVLSKEANASSSLSGKRSRPVPFQQIVDLYHSYMTTNPKVTALTDARKSSMRARWTSGLMPDIETWERYFMAAAKSDFLSGRTQPSPEHPNWRPDLDFMIKEKTIIGLAEGKYRNEKT